jgi:uncharacterized membrane protein
MVLFAIILILKALDNNRKDVLTAIAAYVIILIVLLKTSLLRA